MFAGLDFEKEELDALIKRFLIAYYDNNYQENNTEKQEYIKTNIDYIKSKRTEFIEKLIDDITKFIKYNIYQKIDVNLNKFENNLNDINLKNSIVYIEETLLSNIKLQNDLESSKEKLKNHLEEEQIKLNMINDLIKDEKSLHVNKGEISTSLEKIQSLIEEYNSDLDKDKTKLSKASILSYEQQEVFIKELSASLTELKSLRNNDQAKSNLISEKEKLINKKISSTLEEIKSFREQLDNDFKEKTNNLIKGDSLLKYLEKNFILKKTLNDSTLAGFLYDIILSSKNKELTTSNINVTWIIGNDSLSQNDDRVLSSIMDNCTNKNQLFIIASTNEDILHNSYKCCNYIFLNSPDEAFYRKFKMNFTKKGENNKTIEFKMVNYNQEKSFKQFYFDSNLEKKLGLDLNDIEL